MSEPPDRQKVIEKYVQGLRHDDGYSHGYLKSDEELKLFERSLAAVNERYAVRKSRDLSKSSKSNVVFSMIHCGSRISLDNVPFRVVKETVKVCIFGTEYYKKTQERKKEQVDVPQPCGQTREGRLKDDKAKELQEALDAEQQTVAKETREKPDSSCRDFFPTHRDISNQIQAVLKKDRHSTVDQENARILIEKIRDVFKQWCDNWSPQYWMVDYSKAEISAIKQVFPQSQISICDFHRLQAWQRWLRRKENNISNPDEALRLMKHVASASNQHDFDKAVEVLVDFEYWKNERFRSYIEEVWLSVKELWIMSYRLEFDVVLTTNNGIEAQNRVLKAHYVKSSSEKRSLTSLIMTVVHDFLPDKEVKFHEAARRQSSAYRQYNENVPAYLHNRPHGYAYFDGSLDNWKQHYVQRDSRSAVDHEEDDIGLK
ncbi:hypothetical protein MRX96_037078 [Rhipicephalus microplus]